MKNKKIMCLVVILIIVFLAWLFLYNRFRPETENHEEITYNNNELGFHALLPDGATFQNPIKVGPDREKLYFLSTKPNNLPHLMFLKIEKAECEIGASESINGIQFTRKSGLGYFGGMETGSIDGFYCSMHNGLSYTFVFTEKYNRDPEHGKVVVLDAGQALSLFDQEIQLIKFAYTR